MYNHQTSATDRNCCREGDVDDNGIHIKRDGKREFVEAERSKATSEHHWQEVLEWELHKRQRDSFVFSGKLWHWCVAHAKNICYIQKSTCFHGDRIMRSVSLSNSLMLKSIQLFYTRYRNYEGWEQMCQTTYSKTTKRILKFCHRFLKTTPCIHNGSVFVAKK